MNKGIYLTTLLCIAGLIFLSSCNKDEVPPVDDTQVIDDPDPDPDLDPDPDPDPDPDSNGGTNTIEGINGAFTFNNASFKASTPPNNAHLGDLKINKDTINIWPGIKNRVSILNHTGISVTGVLVHLPGASGYHEAEIEVEESNDTLAVFYVDMDPVGLDLPYNGEILIKPTDGSGVVVDEFVHDLHIDPPFDENIGAGPNGTGLGTCAPAIRKDLHWLYSETEGHGVGVDTEFDWPGRPSTALSYDVEGCCYNGDGTSGCNGAPPNELVTVDNQYSATLSQFIYFFDLPLGNNVRNTYSYEIKKIFNDYSPEDSDFCSRSAGYSQRFPFISTGGDYSLSPNSYETLWNVTIHTRDIATEDIIEVGFTPEIGVTSGDPKLRYTLGCRYYIMEIEAGEGALVRRYYEAVQDFLDVWYD